MSARLLMLGLLAAGCTTELAELDGGSSPDAEPTSDGGVSDASAPRDAGAPTDGGLRPDTGLRREAGVAPGGYWTLEPASVVSIEAMGDSFAEGSTVFLRVQVALNDGCTHAGPVHFERAPGNVLVLTPLVWVDHPPDGCADVTAEAERVVQVPALGGGNWAAVHRPSGQAARFTVTSPPFTCAPLMDGSCIADCQCEAGLRCVPCAGVNCPGRCGQICHPDLADLECEAPLACAAAPDALAAATCAEPAQDHCQRDGDCPPGQRCPATDAPRSCRWTLELGAANRSPCGSHADCEAGLLCVQSRSGDRRCEVPCLSRGMACPNAHSCDPAFSQPDHPWVCEWVLD